MFLATLLGIAYLCTVQTFTRAKDVAQQGGYFYCRYINRLTGTAAPRVVSDNDHKALPLVKPEQRVVLLFFFVQKITSYEKRNY